MIADSKPVGDLSVRRGGLRDRHALMVVSFYNIFHGLMSENMGVIKVGGVGLDETHVERDICQHVIH